MRRTHRRALPMTLLLALAGCTASTADPQWLVELDSDARFDGVQVDGQYDHELLSDRLARAPELADVLGFDRVESDLQAAYAIRASYVVEHGAFEDAVFEQEALMAAAIADGALESSDSEVFALEPTAILNGAATNEVRELVQLNFPLTTCSGVVLTDRVIVTAAHCLRNPALLGPTTLQGRRINAVSVRRRASDGTSSTVYSSRTGSVFFARHFAYAGSGDVAHDIGVIVLPTPMSGAVRGRFYASASRPDELFGTYSIYGWGAVLEEPAPAITDRRRATVDARSPFMWSHDIVAGGVRSSGAVTCGGDSGGAWTATTGGRTLTFGIHSRSGPKFGRCGEPYSLMEGSGVRTKMGWVITMATVGGDAVQCTLYRTTTGVRYHRCS